MIKLAPSRRWDSVRKRKPCWVQTVTPMSQNEWTDATGNVTNYKKRRGSSFLSKLQHNILLIISFDPTDTYHNATLKNVPQTHSQDQFAVIGRVISVTMGVYSKFTRSRLGSTRRAADTPDRIRQRLFVGENPAKAIKQTQKPQP